MKSGFEIADLKLFLEQRLGFALGDLERLPGRSASLNFVAVRRKDGFRFVVKCLSSARTRQLEYLQNLDADLRTCQLPVHRLFMACEGTFSDYRIFFYEYCAGEKITGREVTAAWVAGLKTDYGRLSAELQTVKSPAAHLQLEKMYELATNGLKGRGAERVMRVVRKLVEPELLGYDDSALAVIHGDFHAGNLFFDNGRLSHVIDLEGVRLGYRAEDLVRFFTSMLERGGPLAWRRRSSLLKSFSEVTRIFGYSRREWITALNGIILNRVATRGYFNGIGILDAFRELRKHRIYAKMKELVQA